MSKKPLKISSNKKSLNCELHKDKQDKKDQKGHKVDRICKKKVYGEFIRTFTFSNTLPQLPIVQPSAFFEFPQATVTPQNVQYINENGRIGLLVPRGDYRVIWKFKTGAGATVSLLVNGREAYTEDGKFPYSKITTIDSVAGVSLEYFIKAPLKRNNLISIQNTGTTLLGLDNIPNTLISSATSQSIGVITQISVEKL